MVSKGGREGGSWVQIPSGTRIFFRSPPQSLYLIEFNVFKNNRKIPTTEQIVSSEMPNNKNKA